MKTALENSIKTITKEFSYTQEFLKSSDYNDKFFPFELVSCTIFIKLPFQDKSHDIYNYVLKSLFSLPFDFVYMYIIENIIP